MSVPKQRVLRNVVCVAAMAALVWLAFGQELPKYSADVKVVNVLATVRDKHGKIVNNLSKDDFALDEDGRPQTIRYFTRDTDLPLTLGLLVDTSVSQRQVLDEERSASGKFIDEMVRENKDSAFLIHFDREVELLQDLTSSHDKLQNALSLLQVSKSEHEDQSGGGQPGGGQDGGDPQSGRRGSGGRYRSHGGTLLYDSVFLASNELMNKQQGRKAVIVLSDGVDRGSKTSLDGAIESAQRANTMVYSIFFEGRENGSGPGGWERHGGMGGPWGRHGGGYPGGGYPGGSYPGGGRYPQPQQQRADGKKILERISKETGGRMFEVSKKQPVDQIYQTIQDELRNQYNLGYTSDRKDDDSGQYRKIHLTTKEKDLVVQARDGYYPAPQAKQAAGK